MRWEKRKKKTSRNRIKNQESRIKNQESRIKTRDWNFLFFPAKPKPENQEKPPSYSINQHQPVSTTTIYWTSDWTTTGVWIFRCFGWFFTQLIPISLTFHFTTVRSHTVLPAWDYPAFYLTTADQTLNSTLWNQIPLTERNRGQSPVEAFNHAANVSQGQGSSA